MLNLFPRQEAWGLGRNILKAQYRQGLPFHVAVGGGHDVMNAENGSHLT